MDRLAWFVTGLGLACGGVSPQAVEPPPGFVEVEGQTASFDGFTITLDSFNYSWFPRDDSPRPADGEELVTIRFHVRNQTATPRLFDPGALEALSFGYGENPPSWLWAAIPSGRIPRLPLRILAPAETIEGWLTFAVPKSAPYVDGAVWTPRSGVSLLLRFPGGGPRWGTGYVFGRVTDENGGPVAGANLEILLVDAYGAGDAQIGDCVGFPPTPFHVETDSDGWFGFLRRAMHTPKSCIEARVTAPLFHELAEVTVTGEVPYSSLSIGEEPPEVRIDAILPPAN